MKFITADPFSLGVFLLLAFGLTVIYYRWLKSSQNHKKWLILFVSLTLLISTLALIGISQAYPIPLFPIMLISVMVSGLAFIFSKTASELIPKTSFVWLAGIHSFRFPLELILHQWAKLGTVPETMTWTGSNPDIITGILAICFIPILKRSDRLVWIPQLVGTVLFINVLRVVILSSPFPFSWPLENPLQLILYFPYALIVPLFVLPALIAHILTFRKLLEQKFKQRTL